MIRSILTLCLFFCVCLCMGGPASAQVVQIVKPMCGPLQCRFSIGTGVIIGRRAGTTYTYYVLTAYHLTGNKPRQLIRRGFDYQLTVVSAAGRYPAKIISYNGERLLMLLSIDVPATAPELPAMPIADVLPSAGEAVDIHGHSHVRNGAYGVRSVVLRTVSADVFTITSPFEQGESGGPLVKNGQLIGLCEGYYNATKIGFGPSVIAIRDFLNLPPCGSGQRGGQAGMSMPGRVPGQLSVSGGSSVPVPPPPAPGDQSVGDAPRYTPPGYTPPLYQPGEITPAPVPADRPRAEPDPISRPIDETPAEPIPGRADRGPGESGGGAGLGPEIATRGPTPGNPVEPPTVGERLGNAASTGLTIWNVLAGVGLVTGIGGPIGLGMYALGKMVAARRRRRGDDASTPPYHEDQPSPRPAPTAPIARPVPLAPQQANFIPIPTDYRREAVDWAMAQHGQRYPGAIPSIEAIKSLINQRLQSRGHGRETLHD